MHHRADDDLSSFLIDAIDNDVGIFEQFTRALDQARSAHVDKLHGLQLRHFIENSPDEAISRRRIVLHDPIEDAPEIIPRILIEYDFHSLRPKSARTSASETYLGFAFANRRRTSAACSS